MVFLCDDIKADGWMDWFCLASEKKKKKKKLKDELEWCAGSLIYDAETRLDSSFSQIPFGPPMVLGRILFPLRKPSGST